MRVFNTYQSVPIGVGECDFTEHKIGDAVALADGVYAGDGGFVVVQDGKLLAVHDTIFDHTGKTIFPSQVLHAKDPWLECGAV